MCRLCSALLGKGVSFMLFAFFLTRFITVFDLMPTYEAFQKKILTKHVNFTIHYVNFKFLFNYKVTSTIIFIKIQMRIFLTRRNQNKLFLKFFSKMLI